MPFSDTYEHKSRLAPGVTYTLRRIGYARRVEIDMATLAYRTRLRELQVDYPPFSDRETEVWHQLQTAMKKAIAVPAAESDGVITGEVQPLVAELTALSSPEIQRQRRALDLEYAAVDGYIKLETIRAGLIAIEGGEFTGATAHQFLEHAPPELAIEVYEALRADGMLSGAETKNSQSPSTSGAPVDGTSPSTGALDASSTPSGIVSDIPVA